MGKLFGTDGIRGVVNDGLDAELAFRVGLAAARVLSGEKRGEKLRVTIGKDTRVSGDLLKGALVAGLCSAGADVLDLGTIPTPAVAWAAVEYRADAGIVISASHNPFEYNGIKVFNGSGFKLSDDLEDEIEQIVLSGAAGVERRTRGGIGKVFYMAEKAVDDYVDHLAGTVEEDLRGMHILVDCANGASYTTAARVFDRFHRLRTDVINADPDGLNINQECGSTCLDSLIAMVKAGGYDLGLAFDGDADRCLAVDEHGEVVDGDQIMAICGGEMQRRGALKGDTIVATVMSNLGLRLFARERGIQFIATAVGDRNVLERMLECGYNLGGEQSGHTIFLDYATTGDGELTALQLLQVMSRSGRSLSDLASVCKKYPQVLLNVPVRDNDHKAAIMADPGLAERIAREEDRLHGEGRILVRPSGTEALVRVMAEGKDPDLAQTCVDHLANYIKSL